MSHDPQPQTRKSLLHDPFALSPLKVHSEIKYVHLCDLDSIGTAQIYAVQHNHVIDALSTVILLYRTDHPEGNQLVARGDVGWYFVETGNGNLHLLSEEQFESLFMG